MDAAHHLPPVQPTAATAAAAAPLPLPPLIQALRNAFLYLKDEEFESEVIIERQRRMGAYHGLLLQQQKPPAAAGNDKSSSSSKKKRTTTPRRLTARAPTTAGNNDSSKALETAADDMQDSPPSPLRFPLEPTLGLFSPHDDDDDDDYNVAFDDDDDDDNDSKQQASPAVASRAENHDDSIFTNDNADLCNDDDDEEECNKKQAPKTRNDNTSTNTTTVTNTSSLVTHNASRGRHGNNKKRAAPSLPTMEDTAAATEAGSQDNNDDSLGSTDNCNDDNSNSKSGGRKKQKTTNLSAGAPAASSSRPSHHRQSSSSSSSSPPLQPPMAMLQNDDATSTNARTSTAANATLPLNGTATTTTTTATLPLVGGRQDSTLQQQQEQQQGPEAAAAQLVMMSRKGKHVPQQLKWDQKYLQLKQFKQTYGHLHIPKNDAVFKSLLDWLKSQKMAWRNALKNKVEEKGSEEEEEKAGTRKNKKQKYHPTLSQERMERLVALGLGRSVDEGPIDYFANNKDLIQQQGGPAAKLSNNKRLQRWESLYSQMQAFFEQHGHAAVPSTAKEYSALYSWSIQQRKFWKLTLQGDARLSKEQIQRLQQVGLGNSEGPTNFLNENIASSFQQHFQLLLDFYKEHGHCDVPQKVPKYKKLASWIQHQRVRYDNRQHLAMTGQKTKHKHMGTMSDQDLALLRSIPSFRFVNPKRTSFETRCLQLAEYKAVHGHTRVPLNSGGLGSFVKRTRQLFHSGKLEPSQVATLNAMSFDWNTPRHGRPKSNNNDNNNDSDSDTNNDSDSDNGSATSLDTQQEFEE